MFKEGCPNIRYFSDQMYKCKYLSLKCELINSLIDKLRVFDAINRSKLICILPVGKHVTNIQANLLGKRFNLS